MRQQTLTKEQIRNEIYQIERKWFKDKNDREKLRVLRKHLYQRDKIEVLEAR